jgi:probable HAF family extracellular repeat protein
MDRRFRRYLLTFSSVLGLTAWVSAHGYHRMTFVTIDVPGATFTGARDINSRGQVVGRYTDTDGTNHGWLLSRGELTMVDFPEAGFTGANGINSAGAIVGVYMQAAGEPVHAFLLRGGEFTSMDFPDSAGTSAFGINARGDIVGAYCDGTIAPCPFLGLGNRGYILSGGEFTTIDVPGARATVAWGINSHGDVVGTYEEASGVLHGFMLSDGQLTSIDFPGAAGTEAYGINPRGDIVGAYCPALPCNDQLAIVGRHGFLLSDGEFTPFDFPGAQFTRAFGNDARGDITGAYRDFAGINHGFLIRNGVDHEEENDRD